MKSQRRPKCPKCQGFAVWFSDTGGGVSHVLRCLICGARHYPEQLKQYPDKNAIFRRLGGSEHCGWVKDLLHDRPDILKGV